MCQENWFTSEAVADKLEVMMSGLTQSVVDSVAASVEANGSLAADVDGLERLKKYAADRARLIRDVQLPRGKFVTMLHNDAWCNNFLFR